MNENALKILLRQAILNGLTLFDITGVSVEQSYQPRTMGTNQLPTVFFHKISDYRYGFNRREDKWDFDNDEMVHTELQKMETSFQINALTKTDPTDPTQQTVTDLLNAVAEILAHDSTRAFLLAQNVGILRVTNLTNPFFSDDRDQNESSPSFDVVLTHEFVRRTTSEIIQTVDYEIHRV